MIKLKTIHILCLLCLRLCATTAFAEDDYRSTPASFHTPQLRLYFHACEGNIEGVGRALEEGADIDGLSEGKTYSAIHYAVKLKRDDMVAYLLKKGANPNVVTGEKCDYEERSASPIMMATTLGHFDIAKTLLDAGADPCLPLHGNVTSAVTCALEENKEEFVDAFVKAGVDLSRPIRLENELVATVPALAIAARHGSLAQVKRLVEDYKVAVNPEVYDYRNSPLFTAIRLGNFEVAKYLIDKEADIRVELPDTRGSGCYPLELAASYGRLEITRLLLERGVKPVRNLARDRDPVFLADALGYEGLLELYESHGYKSNYWERLHTDENLSKQAERRVDSIPVVSLFSAKHLDGDWGQLEDTPIPDASAIRIAIIGDDASQDLTSLLAVEWSSKESVEVLERERMDALLDEHQLNRAGIIQGQDLDKTSRLLGADFLLLAKDLKTGKGESACELRLINTRRGILLDTRNSHRGKGDIGSFCQDYVRMAAVNIAKFRKDDKDLKLLSVVNVRADFGNIAGLQFERQAYRLLEYELSKRPDVLLMERQNLNAAVREDHLSDADEKSFQAASGFVEANLEMNASQDGIRAMHLRLETGDGELRKITVPLEGRGLVAALGEAVTELLHSDTLANSASTDLNEDFKRLVDEVRWLRKNGLHQESLDYVRNAMALKNDSVWIWDLYLDCLNSAYPKIPEKNKFSDPKDFDQVFLHEQERMYVMDKVYQRHLQEGLGNLTRLIEGLEGIEHTLTSLDAVSIHRKYGPRIGLLEEDFLNLVRQRVIPLFSVYKLFHSHRGRPIIVHESYDTEVGRILRIARHLRIIENGAVNDLIRQLLRAFSDQYADPVFWPNGSRMLFRYDSYPHSDQNGLMGWMRDEQLRKWVVGYSSPYIGYTFLKEMINDDWDRTRGYSAAEAAEWFTVSEELFRNMNFRDKMFVFLRDPRNFLIGEGLHWETRDEVAIKCLRRMLYPRNNGKNEEVMTSLELEPTQLSQTQELFGECVRQFPWSKDRVSLVKKYIKERLIEEPSLTDSAAAIHNNGSFSAKPWHPQAFGFGDFEPIHRPVFKSGSWYVVGCDQATRKLKDKRFKLFVIDGETLATNGKDIEIEMEDVFYHRIHGEAFIGENHMYFHANSPKEPIVCLNLTSLHAKAIHGYRMRTNDSNDFHMGVEMNGKFYGLVSPDYNELKINAYDWPRLLIEYDPLAQVSRVLANSRRKPEENSGDRLIKDAIRVSYSDDHKGLLISSSHNGYHLWDEGTGEFTKIGEQYRPASHMDESERERFLQMGIMNQERYLWTRTHISVQGAWKRIADTSAVVFIERGSSPHLYKAINVQWNVSNKKSEKFSELPQEKSDEYLNSNYFGYGPEQGCFVTNDNIIAFFKTKDLAKALGKSTLLPERN